MFHTTNSHYFLFFYMYINIDKNHAIPAKQPITTDPDENIAKICFCSHYSILL